MKEIKARTISRLLKTHPVIPDGEIGAWTVSRETIPAGRPVTIVSYRNAIFMGYRPLEMTFSHPLEIASLKHRGSVWMTDSPQELWQIDKATRTLSGKVLIGGLGLGLASQFAVMKKAVSVVHTVELSSQVIALVWPALESIPETRESYLSGRAAPINADLFKFLRGLKPKAYDSAFFDIWQPTGEFAWTGFVVPLRRLCRGKIKRVSCWLEDEMTGQMAHSLYRVVDIPPEGGGLAPHYAALRDAAMALKIRPKPRIKLSGNNDLRELEAMIGIQNENMNDPSVRWLIAMFLHRIGTAQWEKIFGGHWDRRMEAQKQSLAKWKANAKPSGEIAHVSESAETTSTGVSV